MSFRPSHPLHLAGLFLAAAFLLLPTLFAQTDGRATAQTPYDVVLGRPTESSAALSILATVDLEWSVQYGAQAGVYASQTPVSALAAGMPQVVTLTAPAAGQACHYRVLHRRPGEQDFFAGPDRSFQTQRPRGSSFTFDIEADPHHLDNSPEVWRLALANMQADKPDFLIDLGDTFMDEKYGVNSSERADQLCREVRTGFIGIVGHSIPLYLVNGNHDPELGWLLNTPTALENLAVWGTAARQRYFPGPVPGAFYSGATSTDPHTGHPRDAYYAYTWGDALFIMLDPFWYTGGNGVKAKDPWSWTLGAEQYQWLERTLASSDARFKFVFLHNLVGGSFDGQGRGGVELSDYFEWGGKNSDGSDGFAAHRPGWSKPIQELLLAAGVQAVFHGHDHLYVKQPLDRNGDGVTDLIYQAVPQPSKDNYDGTTYAAGYGYTQGILYGNSGHLRIQVTPEAATVEYVRVYLPADERPGRVNRMVSDRYTIPAAAPATATFSGSVVLGRPTEHSVTASVMADTDTQAYIEYGSSSAGYSAQTGTVDLKAAQPAELLLTNLPADATCHYRLRFRSSGQATYLVGEDRAFHTQRAPGSSFTFCIQGDSHPERVNQFNADLYRRTLLSAAADRPDFYMTIGDDFSVDTLTTLTSQTVTQRYALQRPYLGLVASTAPLFLVNGNHEQAAAYLLDGTAENVAVWAQNARNTHYPLPAPDGFYSGDTQSVDHIGLLRDYYAWTWGDALFVVLDPYWHSPVPVDNVLGGGDKSSNMWQLTLGETQYQWLKSTLEGSRARHKFVFAHHVNGTGRGGIGCAKLYEWGGYDSSGKWGFTANRPGWAMPIHELMARNGVTIFFQGHDHLFAREELDGVIYQTLPEPADPNYASYNFDAYGTAPVYPNSGYTRVSVSPEGVRVEYVRTWLPADEGAGIASGTVAWSYTAGSQASQLVNISTRSLVGTGDGIQVGGLVVGGSLPRRVLVRAAGPSLAGFGVAGSLPNPRLRLLDAGGALVGENDDWDPSLAPSFAVVGAFSWATGSGDSALVATLAPGNYTAQVSGNGGTGVALIEAYDLDLPARAGKLVNLSTRSLVGVGDEIQVAGFVIKGNAPKKVVIRAGGPALARFQVAGTLADPQLQLFKGGTLMAENDDWPASLAADFAAVKAYEWTAGSADAALVLTLDPGLYTVQVSGKGGGRGVCLVEVYEAP